MGTLSVTDKESQGKSGKADSTLSVGSGTLSARTGAPTPSRGGGIAVEVRKRRSFSADQQGASAKANLSAEEKRRLEALEKSREQATEEEQKRAEERQQASSLHKMRTQEEEARRQKQEEEARRKQEEEQARKVETEKAAAPPREEARQSAPKFDEPEKNERKTLTTLEEARRKNAGKPGVRDMGKKRGRNAYLEDLEQRYRTISPAKRKKFGGRDAVETKPAEKIVRDVIIPEFITVQELASRMAEKSGEVVKKLMMMGQMVTLTQTIDQETAALIVEEFGHTYRFDAESDIEDSLMDEEDVPERMEECPPIVTVMGHVDHGKTSLLDALRKSTVADGEAGGITQHIGAYQIETPTGRKITFLDTPGHEAFTAMRARGASVTDVVILVVAADDGIMPQTIEAINHARDAGVPIIVAINKIDKPEANSAQVKQELLNQDLIPEEFGGDIVCVDISAKTGKGLESLEEMVLLQADMLELKADPARRADGIVVESRLDKGRGPVATMIVKRGTLQVGDIVVAGCEWGRVRAMMNDRGETVKTAGPAMPVEIIGLQSVPEAGDTFVVVKDDKQARDVAEHRSQKKREKEHVASSKSMSLDNLLTRIQESDVKELNIIVKGDVQGSVEAIADAMNKLETQEVKVRAVHKAVGVITESDVMLANTSQAIVVGFNVRANAQARKLAEHEGVEIRYYSVIYDLVDDVKAAMSGMLSSEFEEKILGRAEVREIFKIDKKKVLGCYVTEGTIRRNAKARLLRDDVVVHDGMIDTLRRFKDDAREVNENFECGMTLEKFEDVQAGDVIECYEMLEITRTIDDLKKAAEQAQQQENNTEQEETPDIAAEEQA